MKIFKVFFLGGCLKLKLRFAEEDKVKKNVGGCGCLLSWASCCETWLKFEIAGVKVVIAKKI